MTPKDELKNEQDAIKQAVEAGYDQVWMPHNIDVSPSKKVALQTVLAPKVLQDPSFWRALGKARGWSPYPVCRECGVAGCSGINHRTAYPSEWFCHASQYFETLLSEGDTSKFWRTLP